jgi:aspartokinase-like uncharacterized kinase
VGSYLVSVEQSGFRKFEQRGITISVAQTARVDIQLQVGSTSESVTVTADAALLKTDSAEHSVVLTGDSINALPLNKKNDIKAGLIAQDFEEVTHEIRGIGKARVFQWKFVESTLLASWAFVLIR